MTNRERYRPFTRDSEASVKLEKNRLALVLCQVRWPALAAFQTEFEVNARKFGSLLEGFPLVAEQDEISIDVSRDGVRQTRTPIFQWSSVDRAWSVALAPNFVTLSSTQYTLYPEFAAKLQSVLTSLKQIFELPLIERIGARYVNVIDDPQELASLESLIKPELLGYQSLPLPSEEVKLNHNLNQALFQVGNNLLQSRAGLVPAGDTLDPALGPFKCRSWVLDIDSFAEREQLFDPAATLEEAGTLADAAYDFFKFSIKDGFVDKFGQGGV